MNFKELSFKDAPELSGMQDYMKLYPKTPLENCTPSMRFPMRTNDFTRNELNFAVLNLFFIPPQMKSGIEAYSQIRLSGKQFKGEMIEGCIIRNGISYQVIYSNCHPYAVLRARELKLSFRKPKKEFGIPPTVIVKIVIDSDGIREEN